MKRQYHNILYGLGSILNIYPTKTKPKILEFKNPNDDLENIKSDWDLVGKSIRIGMNKINEQQKKSNSR